MFQYVWYDKEKYTGACVPELPADALCLDDFKAVSLLYWEEHCVECAVPVCYNNCANWQAREDKKCRRFIYGIKKDKSDKSYRATLALKKWGKVESLYYKGLISPKRAKRIDAANYRFSNFIRGISRAVTWISPTYKLSGALEFFKRKRHAHMGKAVQPDSFVISAWLHGSLDCAMFFEIYSGQNTLVRRSVELKPGFNQILLDIDTSGIPSDSRCRLFASKENTCEITFFFMDFVVFAESAKKKLLPHDAQPAKTVMCVAWDLDNTVWNGILIESDPEKLELKPGVLDMMKWLDERGIIQCIASKNNAEQVEPVIKRLGIEQYFVDAAINWGAKSINIAQMAKNLNINVNTFAFIDDSPHERAEVFGALPCVRVFAENEFEKIMAHEAFSIPVSDESRKRRAMYLLEKERLIFKTDNRLDQTEFLKNCRLKATVSRIENESQLERSYELLLRTNQLNLSGEKYSREEFEKRLSENRDNTYILSLGDRFGDYGQALYMSVEEADDTVFVREFALSCRVAGKFVESALMSWLSEKYGKKNICLTGKDNKKNALLIGSMQNIGFERKAGKTDDELILFAAAEKPLKNSDIVEIKDKTL